MSRSFDITQTAVESAIDAGMVGSVKERVARMAKLATPCRHPLGNRRYGGYVMYVKDGQVLTVSKMEGDDEEDLTGLHRVLTPNKQLPEADKRPIVKVGKLTPAELEKAVNKFLGK